jgi:hypothetical protein
MAVVNRISVQLVLAERRISDCFSMRAVRPEMFRFAQHDTLDVNANEKIIQEIRFIPEGFRG